MNIVRQVLYSPLYTSVSTSARKFFDAGDSIFERSVRPLPTRVEESSSEDEQWESAGNEEEEEEDESVYSWDVFSEDVSLESEDEEEESEEEEEDEEEKDRELFNESQIFSHGR